MYAIVSWLVNTKLELTCLKEGLVPIETTVSKVFIELTNNVELGPPNSPRNSNIALCNFSQIKSYLEHFWNKWLTKIPTLSVKNNRFNNVWWGPFQHTHHQPMLKSGSGLFLFVSFFLEVQKVPITYPYKLCSMCL